MIEYYVIDSKISDEDQQQLAGILLLTVWHLTQMSSVSLHPSVQKGHNAQMNPVVNARQRHHKIVTVPTVFLGMFPVS